VADSEPLASSRGEPTANTAMCRTLVDEDSHEETAIILGTCHILKGDFRKEFDKCQSIDDLLGVYSANIDKRSKWSTDSIY
jgi:hypothetical protein